MLTPQQVQCGVQNELWEPPGPINGDRSIARLTTQGRALKFADDISVVEPGYRSPYVQVRGDFNLGVIEIQNTKNGPDKDTKLVDVRVGIKIDHACFSSPLPIMGLRKGRFSEDASPVLLFRYDGVGNLTASCINFPWDAR